MTERARWWWGTAPSEIRGERTKQYSRQTLVFLGWEMLENIRVDSPLLCLEGVPDLPVAPQDEAGLTKSFQIRDVKNNSMRRAQ